MRTLTILMVFSFAIPALSRGQSVPTAESPAPARVYHLLREDDDGSFLADPAKRQEFWDPIKYIRLRSGRNDWFLSMGGASDRQSEEHTSELQSPDHLVCRLLLEKKKKT